MYICIYAPGHDERDADHERGRGDDASQRGREERGGHDGGGLGVRVENVVGVLEGSGNEQTVERLITIREPVITNMYANTDTDTHSRARVHTHTHVYIYVYICICIYAYTYMFMFMYIYLHI